MKECREIITVRGVRFDDVNMEEAVLRAEEMIEAYRREPEGGSHVVHTPNAEIVQLCLDKEQYYDVINSADMIIPDGAGVILASKILKTPLTKGKVAGVEFGDHVAELAAKKGYRLYLLGSKPGIAEKAAENLQKKYPTLQIAGTADGYFKDDEAVIEKINRSGADILYVALGVPKQEEWMKKNRSRLSVGLMAGLGGSLDVYAGAVKRAPKIFVRLNLEWLYRLLKEPKRIGRMMKLPKFVFGTILCRLKK